jgi:hypothetical protein
LRLAVLGPPANGGIGAGDGHRLTVARIWPAGLRPCYRYNGICVNIIDLRGVVRWLPAHKLEMGRAVLSCRLAVAIGLIIDAL